MGNRNLLFESIFNRKFSDEDIRSFLAQVTKDHPYFSPAQYFLLLQADKESTTYSQQVAKASVLFNNPHWLKFQLDEYERSPSELSNSIVTNNNEIVFAENPAVIYPGFDAPVETMSTNEAAAFISFEQEAGLAEAEETATIDNISESNIEVINEVATLIPNDPEIVSMTAIENEESAPEITEHTAEFENNNAADSTVEDENEFQAKADSNIEEKEPATEIKETTQSGHFNNDDSPLVNEAETDEDISNEKEEIEPLNFRLNIDTSGTTEDTISFEPLHTTDYFASLGIKLSGEIQPTDKLGRQLKSFTEWLKTMKKIHSDQLAQKNGQAEITVQKLAENSNKQQEVVTESMADVLLQQGKAKKAIEVYKKLSLLDSSKIAYFAAKIDQLKEH